MFNSFRQIYDSDKTFYILLKVNMHGCTSKPSWPHLPCEPLRSSVSSRSRSTSITSQTSRTLWASISNRTTWTWKSYWTWSSGFSSESCKWEFIKNSSKIQKEKTIMENFSKTLLLTNISKFIFFTEINSLPEYPLWIKILLKYKHSIQTLVYGKCMSKISKLFQNLLLTSLLKWRHYSCKHVF